MLRRYRFELLALVSVLAFSALFLYASSLAGNGEFSGTDAAAAARVAEMTGIPPKEHRPLVWQWVPPGREIEAGLFALQAAAGGILVGWFFGYWKGQKDQEKERT